MPLFSRSKPDPHLNDPKFFREELWLGISRWTWIKISYLFVVLATAFAFFLMQQNFEHDRKQDRERAYEGCVAGNETRELLATLVEFATTPTGTQIEFDFSAVPSFANLDRDSQVFFEDLEGLLNRPAGSGSTSERLRQFANERLVARDCEALR